MAKKGKKSNTVDLIKTIVIGVAIVIIIFYAYLFFTR